ncbi:hypothetical protein CPC08DRAFT_694693 [Agrocybe pediades]|nr:hypothetical protein CPC08DRAFT_694693 [Agrocybe pediades]
MINAKFSLFVAFLPSLIGSAFAVCAGSTFAIGNQQVLGPAGDATVSRWSVYAGNCNEVDGLTTTENPCTSGTFGCSPPPIFFDSYTSSFTGETFSCSRDGASESCGSDQISVCCR